jgi:hypothetical protein
MDDVLCCPICGNKLRSYNLLNHLLDQVGKTANYAQRICNKGHNHSLMMFVDKDTKKVDLIKISLNPSYSRYLEIDFVNQKCRIACLKDGKPDYIIIEKMIDPDFPDLVKLKERVGLYILFS